MLSVFWYSNHVYFICLLIFIYIYILYNAKLPTSFNLLLSKNTENVHKFHFAINVFGAPDRMMRVKSVWLCTRRGAASTMSLCEGTGESSSLDIGRHKAPKNWEQFTWKLCQIAPACSLLGGAVAVHRWTYSSSYRGCMSQLIIIWEKTLSPILAGW